MTEKRQGWKAMTIRFPSGTHRKLRLLAVNRNTSVQDMMAEAAERIVAQAERAGAAR